MTSYKAAGLLLLNKIDGVTCALAVMEVWEDDYFCNIPSGKRDDDERDPFETAWREAVEETRGAILPFRDLIDRLPIRTMYRAHGKYVVFVVDVSRTPVAFVDELFDPNRQMEGSTTKDMFWVSVADYAKDSVILYERDTKEFQTATIYPSWNSRSVLKNVPYSNEKVLRPHELARRPTDRPLYKPQPALLFPDGSRHNTKQRFKESDRKYTHAQLSHRNPTMSSSESYPWTPLVRYTRRRTVPVRVVRQVVPERSWRNDRTPPVGRDITNLFNRNPGGNRRGNRGGNRGGFGNRKAPSDGDWR